VDLDFTTLEYQLRNRIDSAAQTFAAQPKSLEALDQFLNWVRLRSAMPFRVYPWAAQHRCYAILRSHFPKQLKKALEGEEPATQWVKRFRELATAIGVFVAEE